MADNVAEGIPFHGIAIWTRNLVGDASCNSLAGLNKSVRQYLHPPTLYTTVTVAGLLLEGLSKYHRDSVFRTYGTAL